MSEPIVRPLFFEGQVLAAADLEAAVEHGRGEAARDRRSLHTPGIATGLDLVGRDRTTAGGLPFQEVTLSAGIAVDRTGRQIVLPADERLDEALFEESGVRDPSDPQALYPVFVRGRDVQAPVDPTAPCGTTGPTRMTEIAEVSFGRPGSELEIDSGDPPDPADGVSDPSELVLVGFVQWDQPIRRFRRAALVDAGSAPRYAGALADEVTARAGKLSLRSRRQAEKPALVIDEAGDGALLFGPQDSSGRVVPAFTVDAKGNVTAQGKIAGSAAPGTVRVESGVITDGLVLPLPPGVKPEEVASGKVALQVHLTPL